MSKNVKWGMQFSVGFTFSVGDYTSGLQLVLSNINKIGDTKHNLCL
jgi:hypothetical protein